MNNNKNGSETDSNWRSRWRAGRRKRGSRPYSACKVHDITESAHSGDSSINALYDSCNSHDAVTDIMYERTARGRTCQRGRGNRRPWRVTSRSFITKEDHLSFFDSVDSSHAVDVDSDQASVDNCAVAIQRRCRAAVHGVRGQVTSRQRGRQERGQYSRVVHHTHRQFANIRTSNATDSSVAAGDEYSATYHAFVEAGDCSPASRHAGCRGAWKQERGQRTLADMKKGCRPFTRDSSYIHYTEAVLSSHTAFSKGAGKLPNADIQAGRVHTASASTLASNYGNSVRRQSRGAYMHQRRGRGQLHSMKQKDSIYSENDEMQCQVAQFEKRQHGQSLELVSNTDTDEWMDDDDEDDSADARNVLCPGRGKQRSWNLRGCNRRGRERYAGFHYMLGCKEMPVSCETSGAESVPTQNLVRLSSQKQRTGTGGNKLGTHQTNTDWKAVGLQHEYEMENCAPLSAPIFGDSVLLVNADTDQWIDDDDDDTDSVKVRSVLVAGRGKQRSWNSRGFGRRGHIISDRVHDMLGCKEMPVSSEMFDTEPAPIQESVRRASKAEGTGTGSSALRSQKNSARMRTGSRQLHKAAKTAPVSKDAAGGNVSAAETPFTSDVKQDVVDELATDFSLQPPKHVDENELFWYLLNDHAGQCSISELKTHLTMSDADNIISLVSKLKRVKILTHESDKWKSVAFVFLRGLRMCLYVRAGCKNNECSFLHLCPDFVSESCRAGQQCRFGHYARTPNNSKCFEKCGIPETCSSESILTIARFSNLIVCARYNETSQSECHGPLQCTRLHVCNHFFRGRCLIPDSKCSFGHDLSSAHNTKLMSLFEVKHLLKDKLATVHRMIITVNVDSVARPVTVGKFLKAAEAVTVAAKTDKKSACLASGDQHASLIRQSQKPLTLRRFMDNKSVDPSYCHPQKSEKLCEPKTDDIPADTQVANWETDAYASSSAATKQPNTERLTVGNKFFDNKVTKDTVSQSQQSSDEKEARAKSAEKNAMPQFAGRRSQSAQKFCTNQCSQYVKHLCNQSDDCSERHDALPYLWRVEDVGNWIAFDDSVSIEQAFCDPQNNVVHASFLVCIHLCNCCLCSM